MFRVMTYNVHRCVGVDGKLDVGRVAAVISQCRPDVVALQELDVGRARTGGIDQAHAIANRLGMDFHFHPAFKVQEERYGDAILCASTLTLVKAGGLPGSPRIRGLEPRGALWVRTELDGGPVDIVNTHLGLVPHEQRAQAKALMGPEWLGDRDVERPLIVLGDFNATPRHAVYRIMTQDLTDARRLARLPRPVPTFPSRFPVLVIDHIFVAGALTVTGMEVPAQPILRTASDHLPLIADMART